jgi:hypothetical protein
MVTAEIWFVPLPKDSAEYRCTTITKIPTRNHPNPAMRETNLIETCTDEAVTGLSVTSYELINSIVPLPTVKATMRAVCQKHADLIKQEVEAL